MLAILFQAARKNYLPGRTLLGHVSEDGDKRAAFVATATSSRRWPWRLRLRLHSASNAGDLADGNQRFCQRARGSIQSRRRKCPGGVSRHVSVAAAPSSGPDSITISEFGLRARHYRWYDYRNGLRRRKVMIKDQSTFKKSIGNEAATKSQGMGVVTHTIEGEATFVAWSMDIKFEGEPVPRHLDMMLHNEQSNPSNTPPM